MMTLVAVLAETGIFDFLAVFAFKVQDATISYECIYIKYKYSFHLLHIDNKRSCLAFNKLFMLIYCRGICISR